jgi:BirA family biotin operon repressor/biotin-[acetyl-CoA-carboxylase] ligase
MSILPDQLYRLPTESFIRAFEWHEEIGSTSDRAIELAAAANQALPLLVIAGRQTAGRGRGANRWWSEPGGLMFSLVLEGAAHGFSPDRWPLLSLATALAVGDVVRQVVPAADVLLKWPNDVYVNGGKVCGILLEGPAAAPGRVVIGIGLNVNNSLAAAPPEVRETAIALCDVLGGPLQPFDLLLLLLRKIEAELGRLTRGESDLAHRWRSCCLLNGRTVTLQQGNEQFTGRCGSIDDVGALLLDAGAGPRRLISGTVTRWE